MKFKVGKTHEYTEGNLELQNAGPIGPEHRQAQGRARYGTPEVKNKIVHAANDPQVSDFKNELDYESPEVRKLMAIDNKIWDQLGARDGGAIKKKWDEYKKLVASQVSGSVSQAVCDVLEDQNYHSLYEALRELGKVVAGR